MNGAGTRKGYGYEPERLSPAQAGGVSGKAMMEGYRRDVMGGFEKEKPRYNPMNPDRPQSSPLVDLKDPIQVHLLTETALSDSKRWEILSQEEVDDLKKQCQSLTQRVEQTRVNLAIQSKYRDAAISMAKLYSPGKRRSLLGNRGSGGDSAREAEAERQVCDKRCEELASELFTLEKRLMEPQRRLLQHTAGILQLTHKASKKPAPPPNGQPLNGIPGSPESLYTYTNSRDSFDPSVEDGYFDDDRSIYLALDGGEAQAARPRKNAIEIPLKSPIRKETKVLREEGDRLRAENERLQAESQQLRASNDSLTLELDALQRESDEQLEMIADTEKRFEDLTNRLREVIVRFNPAKNKGYKIPPSGKLEPGDLLGSQLKYLDDGLTAVQEEQELSAALCAKARETESEAAAMAATLAQISGGIQALSQQMRGVVRAVDPDGPPPPDASRSGAEGQVEWLRNSLRKIESEVGRGDKQKVEQVDAVLMGLWDIIQSGLANIQRRKEERRRTRFEQGMGQDDEDMSGDEIPVNPNEPYSLQAFSNKVQYLYAQATTLKDQKTVLQRQIKQQRELNNKSDSEKELQLKQKEDDLQRSEMEANEAQEKLAVALADLEKAQQTSRANATAQDQLRERDLRINALESSIRDLQKASTKFDNEVAGVMAQLKTATEAKEAAEAKVEQAAKDVQAKDEELERLNIMVIELKTEVTIAKAELDGAYGSRAQRAADVAERAKSKENTELLGQIDKLKNELASTLKEFEELTKDTIAAEREKLQLEGKLDDALASRAALENETKLLREKLEGEVASLKEELDAEKLKVAPSSGGGTSRAGASMLSEQFRATMKEERKKFQEELRAEQTQRRKLEDEVRALKRAAGPGKSSLSPR